jgi:hypothetical protein
MQAVNTMLAMNGELSSDDVERQSDTCAGMLTVNLAEAKKHRL